MRSDLLSVYRMVDEIVDRYDLQLPAGYKRRDPNEPSRVVKEAWEDELFKIFRIRFDAQLQMIESYLAANPLKTGGGPGTTVPIDHPESDELLLSAFAGMMESGYQEYMLRSEVVVNWNQYNRDALHWVDQWVWELGDLVDATTGKKLERELALFISEPGYTMGDVLAGMEGSVFKDGRAFDIAVSEVTRTFGKAELVAGQTIHAEFPDVKVVKTWFTNNDGLVCEICQPLHGQTVGVNEQFSSGDDHPPAHAKNCRCWMQSTSDITDSIETYVAPMDPQFTIPGFETP